MSARIGTAVSSWRDPNGHRLTFDVLAMRGQEPGRYVQVVYSGKRVEGPNGARNLRDPEGSSTAQPVWMTARRLTLHLNDWRMAA